MNTTQATGGKVWSIPVSQEPIVPAQPPRRKSRISIEDKAIIAILASALSIAVFTPMFWNMPVDFTFLSPVKPIENFSSEGYIFRANADMVYVPALYTVGSIIIMILTSMFSVIKLHKKPAMKKFAKTFFVVTPIFTMLLGSALITGASKSVENKMSITEWVKERYSVSVPSTLAISNDTLKNGLPFRNSDTQEILELKENDGRIYLYNLEGNEVAPTISEKA